MKKLLYILIGVALAVPTFTWALSTFQVIQGGTGVSSVTGGNLIYGDGTSPFGSVATTSVTCTGSATCTAFTVIGSSPITINATGGSGSAAGDPFTHPFANSFATTSVGYFTGGFVDTASTTFTGALHFPLIVTSFLGTDSLGNLYGFGTSSIKTSQLTNDAAFLASITANSPLSGSGTSGSPLVLSTAGTWSGNAGTATALAANGTNCATGLFPLGVDASGNSETCSSPFNFTVGTFVSTSTPIQFTAGLGSYSSTTINGLKLTDLSAGFLGIGGLGQVYSFATSTIKGSQINNDSGWTSNAGTVTSVGLSLPSFFTVTNSPVTTTGTLTGTINFPKNGIITTDANGTNLIATTSQLTVGSILSTTSAVSLFTGNIGIGTSTAGTALSIGATATGINLADNATSTWSGAGINLLKGCFAMAGVCISGGSGGSGTVTSVAATVPAGFAISGSPVTTSGTLAITANFPVNTILTSNTAGTGLIATTSQLTVGSIIGTTTARSYFMGNVGIASSSPSQPLSVIGSEWHNGDFFHFGSSVASANCKTDLLAGTCMELDGSDNTIGGVNFNVQNRSNGASAFAGYNINNDLANNATTNYAGMFVNSSGYNDASYGTLNNVPSLLQLGNSMSGISIQSFSPTVANSFINFSTASTTPGAGPATTDERMRIDGIGRLLVGTTTAPASRAGWLVNFATTTAPQLALQGTNTDNGWTFRGIGNQLYIATSSPTTFATTTTFTPFSISNTGTTTISGLSITNAIATSTSNVGFNITNGCYAINGTCTGGGSGSGTVTSVAATVPVGFTISGSPITTSGTLGILANFPSNGILTANAAGTGIVATTSQLTVGSILATTTATNSFLGVINAPVGAVGTPSYSFNGNTTTGIYQGNGAGSLDFSISGVWKGGFASNGSLDLGTTTPFAQFQIATTSANAGFKPQLVLSDANAPANSKHWYMTSDFGNFDVGTTSDTGTYATSSALNISGAGSSGAQFLFGTSTSPSFAHFTKGASATTTISIGDLGLSTSKSCVNMQTSAGTAASFYINVGGSLVVELNLCR